MARPHPLPQLILAVLVCLPTLAAAQAQNPDADPIAADVRKAEQTFRLQVLKEKSELTLNIKAILDREIQRAIAADDRLEIAGNIKTQILRVERQLARLSTDTPGPDVPALDDGNADTAPGTTPDPEPRVAVEDDRPDPSPIDDADDPGTFFGLPLE